MNNNLAKFDEIDLPVSFVPAQISFDGYDEMKSKVDGLHESLEDFEVTEDNLKEAKSLRAKLNQFKKSINSEKVRISKQAETPVKSFKDKVKVLTDTVDDSASKISAGIKVYEDRARNERHKKNLEQIKTMCELEGVDPEKIDYESAWDNKSTSKTKFETDVDSQIALLKQRQEQIKEAVLTVSQKADKLALPAEHWINELKTRSLPDVLNAMDEYKEQLSEIAKTQHETKVKETQELKRHGDVYRDANTGEIKDKAFHIRMEVIGTAWQLNNLKNYLKDNAIEVHNLED